MVHSVDPTFASIVRRGQQKRSRCEHLIHVAGGSRSVWKAMPRPSFCEAHMYGRKSEQEMVSMDVLRKPFVKRS